jgi:hypothetical protein
MVVDAPEKSSTTKNVRVFSCCREKMLLGGSKKVSGRESRQTLEK